LTPGGPQRPFRLPWKAAIGSPLFTVGRLEHPDGHHLLQFVFAFDGDLHCVMCRRNLDEQGRADRLRDDFDAILERHGFWHEKINEVIDCNLGQKREREEA
jgi:hypothetical protein